MESSLRERYERAVNRLVKWRMVLAGWQLGTRPDTDPECHAVRDTFEKLILLRVEVTALTGLLMEKGVITNNEFMRRIITECDYLHTSYEKRFPGFKATDVGMDIDTEKVVETMRGWKP